MGLKHSEETWPVASCHNLPRENLHLGARGADPLWGIFEVVASSAAVLWAALERAAGQDTEPLYLRLRRSIFPPELEQNNCRWQETRSESVKTKWWKAVIRSVGCCFN